MREHSSAGRASALQAEGHRFEPYCSHQIFSPKQFIIFLCGNGSVVERCLAKANVASSNLVSRSIFLYRDFSRKIWRHSQVVRHGSAKPLPPVRIWVAPPNQCRDGEIGRRKGLKIPRWQHRTGSSPVPGTKRVRVVRTLFFIFNNISPYD